MYCLKIFSIHQWLCHMILWRHPFSAQENKDIQRHTQYEKLSLNTSKHYLSKLTRSVQLNLFWSPAYRFELIFDSQSNPEAHYVSVFVTFLKFNQIVYLSFCLSLLPPEHEIPQNSDEHVMVLKFVLVFFSKSMSNVVAIICDNCNVNRAISCELLICLLECVGY